MLRPLYMHNLYRIFRTKYEWHELAYNIPLLQTLFLFLHSLFRDKVKMRNMVQFLGGQTVVSEWKPMDPFNYVALDTYTGHLMGVKYDQHDVTVVFSNNTPNLRELRVGQCFTFSGSKDILSEHMPYLDRLGYDASRNNS